MMNVPILVESAVTHLFECFDTFSNIIQTEFG
jgi:hypothetical protein